jgi:DNA polymerase-4
MLSTLLWNKDNPSCEVNLSLWVVLKTGAVAAASEARRFGKSAMSGFIAKKNCPDLIFVSPRFDRYKEISNKIQSIFRSIRIWSSRFH